MAEKGATDKALDVASKAPLPPQAKAAVEAAKALKEAKNFWSFAKEFLWGSYEKRAGNLSAVFMLISAAILDLISVVPILQFITTIFAGCLFFVWFLLLRFRFQKNILKKFIVNLLAPLVEAIPAISAFPAILAAVGFNLFQMRLEDWLKHKEDQLAKETAQKEEQERQEKVRQEYEQRYLQQEAMDADAVANQDHLAEIQSELEDQADEQKLAIEEERARADNTYVTRDIVPSSQKIKVPQANSLKSDSGGSSKNGGIRGSNQLGKAA